MIRLQSIWKSYVKEVPILRGIDLEIADGETLVLIGASGCGKSTTLKLINGLALADSGSVEVQGRRIESWCPLELKRSIGYVFQGIGLFPHMTIRENVSIVPRLVGWDSELRRNRADELLGLVGLQPGEFGDRYPRELSGGQQQRVGVARALAVDPDILLMDEPFGSLDPISRENLQHELLDLKRRLRKTIVFVTHDLFEAIMLADRIAVMNLGRIEQIGTAIELMSCPATEFVSSLFERARKQSERLGEING